MFAKLIAKLKEPQHRRMMARKLDHARRDLVNAAELAEYYEFQRDMLQSRIERLEMELEK